MGDVALIETENMIKATSPCFFVRYDRQAPAVLARADICRATDSDRLCLEPPAASQRIGKDSSLSDRQDSFSGLFARVKINSVPTPSVLITLIFWLWALMISFTIESPRPVPFRSFPLEESIL